MINTNINFGSLERRNILIIVIIGLFVAYGAKLFTMQIINQDVFDERASDNSIKTTVQTPLRGVFYDRNLELIVENTPAYTVRVTPYDYDTTNNDYLEKVLGLKEGELKTILTTKRYFSPYVPIKVKRGVSFKGIGWIDENSEHLPGVDYIIELQRGYPAGIMASHIFGYTREISPALLEQDDYYTPGDAVGYAGLEKKYERYLRGEKGYEYEVVDSKRRTMGPWKDGNEDVPSIKGKDLVLTLDADVQRIAEEMLEGKTGAVVAIEPATGEVIAMASAPNYDLNEFSYITSRNYLRKLAQDPQVPQFNRATLADKYPPGSTFKPLCAIAALDLGVITPEYTINCGGGFTFGRFFKCHGVHGSTNVYKALEGSCNTFFYQLIFKIGLDRLADYANRFGLGHETGIDLFEEAPGLIPTTAYYESKLGENWPRGILVSLGIGQGEISSTPLQLAHYTAFIANDGRTPRPHLVRGYFDENRNVVPFEYEMRETGVKPEVMQVVKEGMFRVVHGGGGTARRLRMDDIHISGKTGTAQNPHGKDHALFIGYAPSEDPKIAVSVLVENSGFGSTHAAPVAKAVIEGYLRKHPELMWKEKSDFVELRQQGVEPREN